MAASRLHVAGFFLGKCVNRCGSSNTITLQFSRQICTSSALCRKDFAKRKPETLSEEFIQKQTEEFNIGKRHLANMMGEDPENFTQEDIDKSIAYLFPSGLFIKKANPIMKHPDEIFPKQKALQWGKDKRPFHFLFYTGKQSYFSLMHTLYGKVLDVEEQQDRLRAKGLFSTNIKAISLGTTRWVTKEELEQLLVEKVSDTDYNNFIQLMMRLLSMPYCRLEEQFIMQYRKTLVAESKSRIVPPLQRDDKGVAFSTADGQRKTSKASVVLRDCGSGRVTINGQEFLQYFMELQDREQIMFPLQFMDMLGRFDLECTASGGGRASQAGALRLATSRALLSFVSEKEAEDMRQAGLLTVDIRIRERKKPGQEGARRKYTWNKR